MKRLFRKQHNPKVLKALKIIGYTALGIAAAAFVTFIILMPVLSATDVIRFY